MTAFLRLNGLEVPVLDGSAKASTDEQGTSNRSANRTARGSRLITKGRWSFTVGHTVPKESLAWRDLLLGEYQKWTFESSLYSTKGKAAVVSGTSAITTSQHKYGAKSLKVVGNDTCTIDGLVPSGRPWTVMTWHNDPVTLGAGWQHLAAQSDGSKFLGGVANALSFLGGEGLSFTGGVVSINGTNPEDQYLDDVVIFPTLLPASWIAAIAGAVTTFGPDGCRRLTADGSFIENNISGGRTVLGKVGDLTLMQGRIGGTFYDNLHVIEATVEEV